MVSNRLKKYVDEFIQDRDHWYISKYQSFTHSGVNTSAKILFWMEKLLGNNPDGELYDRYIKFSSTTQQELFPTVKKRRVVFDQKSKLFLALLLRSEGIMDATQNKRIKQVLTDFSNNLTFDELTQKHGGEWLQSFVAVWLRNPISWLTKFGFAFQGDGNRLFVTEVGREFINNENKPNITFQLFANQLKKFQIWNPAYRKNQCTTVRFSPPLGPRFDSIPDL